MSNFYLCDRCRHKIKDMQPHHMTCECFYDGVYPRTKRVMYDYHGEGGRRYDKPTDVCLDFERREDA